MNSHGEGTSAPLLVVRGLSKSFDSDSCSLEVLKGIDLDLYPGTTTALVGASGAGKSTLLHILGALDRPTSGSVTFKGESVFSKNMQDLAEFRNRSIGFVFQFHHLLHEFTALENVMMPALIARLSSAEARERAERLLQDVGLAERMTHRPGKLSGGEQQRVAIARALVLNPEILLADEPTGNLDTRTSDAVHAMMVELQKKRGLTLVIVTHNERIAASTQTTISIVDGKAVKYS